ncbi:hypothetical protein Tco_1311297 [Tanacetum coccineum]
MDVKSVILPYVPLYKYDQDHKVGELNQKITSAEVTYKTDLVAFITSPSPSRGDWQLVGADDIASETMQDELRVLKLN